MASVWYVERNGEAIGPLSAAQLKRLADDGKLKPADRVRRDEGAWVAASTVRGLFTPPASQTAPPTPEPLPPEPHPAPEPKKPKGLWGQLGDAVKDAASQVQKAADAARTRAAKPTPDHEPDEEAPRKPKKPLDQAGDAVKDATKRVREADSPGPRPKTRAHDEEPESRRKRPAQPALKRHHLWILAAIGGAAFLVLVALGVVAVVMMGRDPSLARTIDLPGDAYGSVHFLPDGERAVVGSRESIQVWDLRTGQNVRTIRKRNPSNIKFGCDLSPDGSVVLAGDQQATLYDIESGQERWSVEMGALRSPRADFKQALVVEWHTRTLIDGQLVSIDGKTVAPPAPGADFKKTQVVFAGCDLQVWDLEGRSKVREFKGPSPGGWGGHPSPDGEHAVLWHAKSASDNGGAKELVGPPMRLWDLKDGREILAFGAGHPDITECLFSPDGRRLLTRHEGGDLILWDVGTGKELRRLTGHSGGAPRAVFAADGRRVLSGGKDKSLRLWDAETGAVLHQWNIFGNELSSLALSPKGDRVLTIDKDGDDWKMRVWSLPK